MSTLRQRLKQPETYLAMLVILFACGLLDSFRNPSNQIVGHGYILGVRIYQVIGRPLLKGHIQCRYQPTCSEYSIEAVRRYGIHTGLQMTINRIRSCTDNVSPGTSDPVPIQTSIDLTFYNNFKNTSTERLV